MILDKYTTFAELTEFINSISDIKIEVGGHVEHRGIHFSEKNLPISINEHEFNFIHDYILQKKLKNGYELATGTGISSICSGIALKKNGGKLITLDNYSEENLQEIQVNSDGNYSFSNSIAYRFINNVLKKLNFDNVDLMVGSSPVDSVQIFNKNQSRFDYVFLDCPKSDSDFERDIRSLDGFLADNFTIFVHDTHTFTNNSFSFIESHFGLKMNLIHEYYIGTEHYSKRFFPLAIITNM